LEYVMTVPSRSLSRQLAPLVAELELRQPVLVTLQELAALAEGVGLRTPPKVVAARLRATGWLLPTGQRGVYEFAPGAHAGPYGHGDPFIDLRAALLAEHSLSVALHSALWLHGMAERAPDRHELAAPPGSAIPVAVKRRMRVVRFSAQLPAAQVDQLPVHQAATILVHAATRPGDVRGWTTLAEALPELAARSTADDLDQELIGRPSAVRPRLAYLLGGVAPAIADRLQPTTPSSVTWFGSSRTSRRYDKRFNVADGLLPFDPRTLRETA
jgi:predicted transcriptional regulator of viral defense system